MYRHRLTAHMFPLRFHSSAPVNRQIPPTVVLGSDKEIEAGIKFVREVLLAGRVLVSRDEDVIQ